MSHFDWDFSQEQQDFFNFYSALIKFRKTCPLLGREEFLKPDEITWHEDDWGNKDSSFLAFTLHGKCVLAFSGCDVSCASQALCCCWRARSSSPVQVALRLRLILHLHPSGLVETPTDGPATCRHFDYADLYVAFNAHAESVQVTLPPPPHGTKWCRIADTNLKTDRQWVDGGNKGVEPVYTITGRSSVLLISKPE